MIKVNLLDSVTDRAKSAAVIETKVANPRMRSTMLMLVIGVLAALAMVFDYASTNSAHAEAQSQLEKEERVAAQMAAVNKEQAELEKKTKDIQVRIDAIKKLRTSQQGPVAVLSAINERIPAIANFRLETIEQKGGELVITGDSPNEAAITQFGRSLEFSSGLFTNVNIETLRKELQPAVVDPQAGIETSKVETVSFKVKCKYTVPGTAAAAPQAIGTTAPAAAPAPATQIAQK